METMGQAAETGLRRVARNQAEYARLRLYTWLWAFGVAGVTLALLFTVWLFGVQVRDSGMASHRTGRRDSVRQVGEILPIPGARRYRRVFGCGGGRNVRGADRGPVG